MYICSVLQVETLEFNLDRIFEQNRDLKRQLDAKNTEVQEV